MKKLYNYLFCKPKIKVGEKLNYYNHTCLGLEFHWDDGLWFIETGAVKISHGVELFYKDKKRKEGAE